jgi:hypothetical protein
MLPASIKRATSETGTRTALPSRTQPILRSAIHARIVFGRSDNASAACWTVSSRLSFCVITRSPPLTSRVKGDTVWVDMELGHHIDRPVLWRCERVEVNGDELSWKLDCKKAYDVLKAYEKAPHREFIEASTDDALQVFMRRWGPLRPMGNTTIGCDSIRWYRKQQDQWAAFMRLLASIDNRLERRQALSNVLRMCEDPPDQELDIFFFLKHFPTGNPANRRMWCEKAPQSEIDRLSIRIVNEFPFTWNPCFVVKKLGGNEIVRARPNINSLYEAFMWMVWQDILLENPFRFCVECGALIVGETKHERRFCGTNCARRKTDRDWRRRKRAKERELRGPKRVTARAKRKRSL